jgi:calcium-dependent protein kinase
VTIGPWDVLDVTHGTSYYIAPEVLGKKYTEKCDIWSIGVILYILLSGKPPFDGDNDEEITEQVKIGQVNLKGSVWNEISAEGKSMIKKMLTKDQKLRISAREALVDTWFAKYASK